MKVFRKAAEVREKFIGNKVYLRGLIELSNICRKNCFYCGIRHDNKYISRYSLNDHDVLEVARHAWQAGYGSVIIQTGERTDKAFTNRISNLIRQIKLLSKDQLGITLSCGVQDRDTYREWFEWGAHRYLLRIETSSEALYNKLHPDDSMHSYSKRLKALEMLKRSGFHTGTGVMIGLPFQTVEDLADDLLFFKKFDVDIIGLGPYIPHLDTPTYKLIDQIPSNDDRFELSQRMIALARILMKDVSIKSATAFDALNPSGRAIALISGANIYMPNLTPTSEAKQYEIYDNRPIICDHADCAIVEMTEKIKPYKLEIIYEQWGDSPHFGRRIMNN